MGIWSLSGCIPAAANNSICKRSRTRRTQGCSGDGDADTSGPVKCSAIIESRSD